jgi:hypothetical protein
MGEMRNAYNTLVGKPERKRPLGRPLRRWDDNIKTDIIESGKVWAGCTSIRTGTSGGLL